MTKKNVIKKSVLTPTVLIAGGAGFIGSHLVETLLLKGSRVIVLDNFRSGKRIFVDHLLKNPKFALFDVDINTGLPQEIESVDYIFHIASLEEHEYEVGLDSLLTNAVGTKNLLDLAKRSDAKFVLASSIYVYQGMMSQLDLQQYFGKTSMEEGKYSITEAKRYAEALVWEYYKKYGTDVRIARFPEIYGPKMDLETSGDLGRLLDSMKNNRDLVIYGEGTEKDYYLYITDAVSGIIKCIFGDNTKGKIFSLINLEPYSTLEIAFLFKSLANREIKLLFESKPNHIQLKKVFPDIATLKDLDWQPKVPFKDGIIQTLSWLGYETNTYSFKPAKLIEEKKKEKMKATMPEQMTSLAEINQPAPALTTQDSQIYQPTTVNLPKAVSQRKIHLPVLFKLKLPHFAVNPKVQKYVLPGLAILIFAFIMFAAIPGIQVYRNLSAASSAIFEVPTYLQQFNPDKARSSSDEAYQHFVKSEKPFSRLRGGFYLLGKKDAYRSLSSFLSSAKYASKFAYYLSKSLVPVANLWETLRPDTAAVFDMEAFEKAKSDYSIAQTNLQLAQAEYKNVDPSLFDEKIQNALQSYKDTLNNASSNIEMMTSVYTGLSDLIGVTEPKKYIILFQNSNEIRPTGGFIGSYAILKMDKGKITELTIDDIYNPDGQIDLRGISVASPEPIAQFLNEPNLHLRNSNWNPHFPDSARNFTNLYQQVTDERVDGVIAIDLNFVKELLSATGPIFLTAYNEEISANNLYERAQYHSEFNYEDGSSQKRSFLTVLGGKLLEKMFATQKEDLPKLWKAFTKSLDERHLMISLNNNPLASFIEEKKWDGGLVKQDGDYLYVVNANVGGTKANYFVKNSMKYEVLSETRDGLLRGVLTLNYKHTGESDSWPGGPYTNYLRVMTPKGSNLTGAKIKFSQKDEQDIFKEIKVNAFDDFNSFETSFVLSPKDSVDVIFYYDIPELLKITKDNMNYHLYWQKQPGTEGDTFEFVFNPPFGLKADATHEQGELNQDQQIFVSLDPL